MRLALAILVLLATLGILVHGFFSLLRPYDVMLQSIKLLPRTLFGKPLLGLLVLVVMALLPMGGPIMGAIMPGYVAGILGIVLYQALMTLVLALVAVRIHRGVVKRDKARWLKFGRLEWRMAGMVLSVWLMLTLLGIVPLIASTFLSNLLVRMIDAGVPLLTWVLVTLFAYVGPAASLQDPAPLSRSLATVRKAFTATATIVILSRGLQTLATLGSVALLTVAGTAPIYLYIALPIILGFAVIAFFVSETAVAIALTRAWEDVYDEGTRGRDYNADWH